MCIGTFSNGGTVRNFTMVWKMFTDKCSKRLELVHNNGNRTRWVAKPNDALWDIRRCFGSAFAYIMKLNLAFDLVLPNIHIRQGQAVRRKALYMVIVGISDFELGNLRKCSFHFIPNSIAVVKRLQLLSGLKVSPFHTFTQTMRTKHWCVCVTVCAPGACGRTLCVSCFSCLWTNRSLRDIRWETYICSGVLGCTRAGFCGPEFMTSQIVTQLLQGKMGEKNVSDDWPSVSWFLAIVTNWCE